MRNFRRGSHLLAIPILQLFCGVASLSLVCYPSSFLTHFKVSCEHQYCISHFPPITTTKYVTRNEGGEEGLSFASQFEGRQSRAGEGIAVGCCLGAGT